MNRQIFFKCVSNETNYTTTLIMFFLAVDKGECQQKYKELKKKEEEIDRELNI